MKVEAVSLPDNYHPSWRIEIYKDPNGNWFGAASRVNDDGSCSIRCYTATYDNPLEVLTETLNRVPVSQ